MIKYIYAFEPNRKLGMGMEVKIEGQVKALNNIGLKTIKEGHEKPSKISRALPFNTTSIDWDEIDLSDIGGIYIRYLMSDYKFIRFLKRAKKERNAIVCVEFATFPYQKELKKYSLKSIRDKLYRGQLKNYVDHAYYMGGKGRTETIFGIDCTRLCNGFDFDKYRIHRDVSTDASIRMIAVADFQKSHGYERIIRGIANYYAAGGDRKIEFYMVGEGEEKPYYEKLTRELNLNNIVHFMGVLTGEDLDKAYDNANIGVEVFGFYKRGIDTSSSLKSREYLARGIPFICGAPNDAIDASFPYCLFFPNDDSIVDIRKVIDFFDRVYNGPHNKEEIANIIRKYGIENVSWDRTMRPVRDFFTEKMKLEDRIE